MEKVTSIRIEPTDNDGSIVYVQCEKKSEEGSGYTEYKEYKYAIEKEMVDDILKKIGYLEAEEEEAKSENPKLINPKNW